MRIQVFVLLLLLHLIALEAIIDQHSVEAHVVALHHLHTASHRSWHRQTLDLDKIAHVLTCAWVRELALHLLLLHWVLLLHLEFNVVEYTVEIHWIELDWNLYRRVLLEVNKRLLALFWVNHTCCSFNTFALFHCDLFAIEHHQLNEAFDHNHAIVGLASDRIVEQGEIQ